MSVKIIGKTIGNDCTLLYDVDMIRRVFTNLVNQYRVVSATKDYTINVVALLQ